MLPILTMGAFPSVAAAEWTKWAAVKPAEIQREVVMNRPADITEAAKRIEQQLLPLKTHAERKDAEIDAVLGAIREMGTQKFWDNIKGSRHVGDIVWLPGLPEPSGSDPITFMRFDSWAAIDSIGAFLTLPSTTIAQLRQEYLDSWSDRAAYPVDAPATFEPLDDPAVWDVLQSVHKTFDHWASGLHELALTIQKPTNLADWRKAMAQAIGAFEGVGTPAPPTMKALAALARLDDDGVKAAIPGSEIVLPVRWPFKRALPDLSGNAAVKAATNESKPVGFVITALPSDEELKNFVVAVDQTTVDLDLKKKVKKLVLRTAHRQLFGGFDLMLPILLPAQARLRPATARSDPLRD